MKPKAQSGKSVKKMQIVEFCVKCSNPTTYTSGRGISVSPLMQLSFINQPSQIYSNHRW